VSDPLVVVDADVLGRRRTGDETYVAGLLGGFSGEDTSGLRLAAATRRPDLVPAGVEPVELQAGSQILRMAITLPRLLRRLQPAVAHFLHALPRGYTHPAVVTIQDLSFERDATVMGTRDRLIFRRVVPRAARKAARILTLSELTKRDLIELYGVPDEKIVVTPPGPSPDGDPYALFVSALQPRKDPVAAIEALALLGPDAPRLVLVGPDKGGRAEAEHTAERQGIRDRVEFRGHVSIDELASLYRGAACFVFPSRYEGFGLPVLEAMASGAPVVTTTAGALPEAAGDAAILVEPRNPVELAGGIERALADRKRLVAAGIARAARFTWAETARRTLAVYRELT
jgi:glycosyltransferase involved in cell wall biosynthesis